MKKVTALLLALVLLTLLAGCNPLRDDRGVFYVNIDGRSSTLIFRSSSSGRIIEGHDTYEFGRTSDGINTSLILTYPDGQTATLTRTFGADDSVWVDGADLREMEAAGYLSIYEVEDAIESYLPRIAEEAEPGPSPLPALIPVGVGLFLLLAPHAAWWLRAGWMFKGTEPSELALGVHRVLGGILLFIGGVWFLVALIS